MDRILIILKKENGPRASSAPALGLNTIIFKHVYLYMQQTQVSVYRTIGPLVNLIVSIPGLSVLTLIYLMKIHELRVMSAMMGEQTVKASLKTSNNFDQANMML